MDITGFHGVGSLESKVFFKKKFQGEYVQGRVMGLARVYSCERLKILAILLLCWACLEDDSFTINISIRYQESASTAASQAHRNRLVQRHGSPDQRYKNSLHLMPANIQ